MDVSIFIAKGMGIYLIVLSAAMLIHAENFISIVTGIFHNAALQFVLGMNILIFGILMIISHNIWDSSWVVLITILGWLIFFKGIFYIMFPRTLSAMVSKATLRSKNWLYAGGIINLVLGIYLSYMGFLAS